MAGDWIKIENTTPDKPEVFAIADELGIDADSVVGKLVRIWVWADQQTYDGNAGTVTSALLDRLAGHPGFTKAMISAGWLLQSEGSLAFPRFTEHNGDSAKSRALGARRAAKARQNKSETQSSRKSNASSVTSALPREEKRREESKQAEPVAGVLPADLVSLMDQWESLPGPIAHRIRNRGSKAIANGWKRVQADPEAREAFDDLPELMREIERAKFLHGKGYFRFTWLFGCGNDGEWNVVKIMEQRFRENGKPDKFAGNREWLASKTSNPPMDPGPDTVAGGPPVYDTAPGEPGPKSTDQCPF